MSSSAEHFQGLLNTTITRLDGSCKEWQKILDDEENKIKCPDDAVCEIMSALGKTNLLLNSKLPQFKHLVEELSRGQYGHRPITPADLQGFWDLVSLEISDVDDKFEKLARRKSTDWAPLPVETKPDNTSPPKKSDRLKNGGDKVDGKAKNFDHLRSAAKSRLALAKAKMQEAKLAQQGSKDVANGGTCIINGSNGSSNGITTSNGTIKETNENGIQRTVVTCPSKDSRVNPCSGSQRE